MPINSTPIARTYLGEQTPPQTDARLPADCAGSRGLEQEAWSQEDGGAHIWAI